MKPAVHPIHPILTEASKDMFVPDFKPFALKVGNTEIKTAPLVFDKQMDLLALSTNEALLANGMHSATDVMVDTLALCTLFIQAQADGKKEWLEISVNPRATTQKPFEPGNSNRVAVFTATVQHEVKIKGDATYMLGGFVTIEISYNIETATVIAHRKLDSLQLITKERGASKYNVSIGGWYPMGYRYNRMASDDQKPPF